MFKGQASKLQKTWQQLNSGVEGRDFLHPCYNMVQLVYSYTKSSPLERQVLSTRVTRFPTSRLLLWLERNDLLPLELYVRALNTCSTHHTSCSFVPQAAEDAHSNWLELVLVNKAFQVKFVAFDCILHLGNIQDLVRLLFDNED